MPPLLMCSARPCATARRSQRHEGWAAVADLAPDTHTHRTQRCIGAPMQCTGCALRVPVMCVAPCGIIPPQVDMPLWLRLAGFRAQGVAPAVSWVFCMVLSTGLAQARGCSHPNAQHSRTGPSLKLRDVSFWPSAADCNLGGLSARWMSCDVTHCRWLTWFEFDIAVPLVPHHGTCDSIWQPCGPTLAV